MSLEWLWGILLVGAMVLLAVAGTLLARRWVGVEVLKLNNEVAGFIYAPIYGELGRKQEALENWRKLLADEGDWSAESFETWWRMRNMRDEDIAKLMDGVYKSGVVVVEVMPGQ